MTTHILVCPFNERILSHLQGRALVVKVDKPDEICRAAADVSRFKNHLHCVLFYAKDSLADIAFQEDWKNIPLALYASEIGHFSKLANNLSLIRHFNLRVHLPIDREENYTSLRILSSLGIASTVVFGEKNIDWEKLSDLMTYTILGRVHHAPIEPFRYISSHYNPTQQTGFDSVYFDDPSKYLHLNEEGFVSLSHKDLMEGRFIADDINQIGDLSQCPAYIEYHEAWKQFFLKPDGCAYCQGWRVCLGKFSPGTGDYSGCKQFFIEFMEVVEQYQSTTKNKVELWQL